MYLLSVCYLLLVIKSTDSVGREIIMMLGQIPCKTSSRQQGQQCLYTTTPTKRVDERDVLPSTPSGNSLSSSMTVSSSSQQISTVADREICSPGCAATVIDWT